MKDFYYHRYMIFVIDHYENSGGIMDCWAHFDNIDSARKAMNDYKFDFHLSDSVVYIFDRVKGVEVE